LSKVNRLNEVKCDENFSDVFDPQKAIRIVYETPHGCDEISGTITLKASVQGEGAPTPAAMRYELRTSQDGAPLVFTSNSPTYEVSFDTTQIRDGLVFYTVIPLDGNGDEIDIKASPYFAPGIIPPFRNFMVNNHNHDLSKPLIVLGSVLEFDLGELTGTWTAEQLKPQLFLALNFMSHLRELGFFPDSLFIDTKTIVLDPSDPLAYPDNPPSDPVDMMGDPVEGTPIWHEGDPSYYEVLVPNGILDIYEETAFGEVVEHEKHGFVKSYSEVVDFYGETIERLTYDYNLYWNYYNMLEFEEPVRWEEPKNLLKEEIQDEVSKGATSVWIYDFYYKANDFEMSAGAWPHFQKSIDEVNEEIGDSIYLGAIQTNNLQLMDYDSYFRAVYLGVRGLVKTSVIPVDKKVGIIIAGHGSGTTNRLYDVSNVINNPIAKERMEDYFSTRMEGIHSEDTPYVVCYSEYANSPDDGRRGVGEQVSDWVNEGYDYILVFPWEWDWASMDIWVHLREGAVEITDPGNEGIYIRDERGRSEIILNNTHLIIGESIFEQRAYNPAPYHYLRSATAQLLEDRLIELTNAPRQKTLSGKIAVEGEGINLSLDFSDSLLTQRGKITLQNSGVRAEGITLDIFVTGIVIGVLDKEDMANYIFALLAENAIDVESVEVEWGSIVLLQVGPDYLLGFINTQASGQIAGQDIKLKFSVGVQ